MDISLSSQLTRSLMDGFREGVALFDAEGRLVFANAAARSTVAETTKAPSGNGYSLIS